MLLRKSYRDSTRLWAHKGAIQGLTIVGAPTYVAEGLCAEAAYFRVPKLAKDFDNKLVEYQRFVIGLHRQHCYMMGHMGDADETLIWFDMPSNWTVTAKGSKQVELLTTSNEHSRFTAMLPSTADGKKLPFYIIVKRKGLPEE